MECLSLLVPLALVAVVVVVAAYAAADEHRRWLRALQVLADGHVGLRMAPSGEAVVGEVQGVVVHIDSYTTGTGDDESTWTRWRLDDPRGLSASSSLSAVFESAGLGAVLTGEGPQIGDRQVDDTVRIGKPMMPPAVGWFVEGGEWTRRQRARTTDVQELEATLSEGLDLCRAVRGDGGLPGRLIEVIRTDPVPDVRVRALQSWIDVGEPPEALLLQLAQDDDTPAGLLAARTREDLVALQRLVRAPSRAVQVGAATTLAELLALGKGPIEDLVGVRAALVVGLDVEPWVEPCIQALGALGTVAEVEALRSHADGGWPGPRMQRARQAIRVIQARVSGAEAGQVSIVEGDAGALSVAHDPQRRTGRLSPRKTES